MWTWLLVPVALAGNLVVDAKVPVEIWVSGQLVGELVQPSELHLEVDAGTTELNLVVAGKPQAYTVDVPTEGSAVVVVGRTGVTTGERAAPETEGEPAGSHPVEFRSAAREDIVLVVGEDRIPLAPREVVKLDLAPGSHPMSLRNKSGTIVWAHGTLDVGGDGLVVQVADGRMPETSGPGGSFHPDQR